MGEIDYADFDSSARQFAGKTDSDCRLADPTLFGQQCQGIHTAHDRRLAIYMASKIAI